MKEVRESPVCSIYKEFIIVTSDSIAIYKAENINEPEDFNVVPVF